MTDGTRRVVVIGAGMGGLAAAARLAAAGHDVTVLERAARPGGKMRRLMAGGREVDAGPTVFTMRWVFEELFAAAGASLGDELRLSPARVLARHVWPDGSRFDLHAEPEATAAAVADFAGREEAERYRAFARHTERAYLLFRDSFIRASRPSPVDVIARIGLRGIPELFAVRPAANMWHVLGQMFADPRLRQLFGRYATYCGSSPMMAPATLMLIAHVEREGVWLVEGGMQRLAASVAELVRRRGGRLRFGAHVERIETAGGRASGVILSGGERLPADAVVFNGDAAALSAGLLGGAVDRATRRVAPRQRSLSAMVWSATTPATGFPLSHHTIFFGPDYPGEFDDMLDRRLLPRDPSTYVCAEDRDAHLSPAPEGAERLHIQINAPADGDRGRFTEEEIARCQEETLALLDRAGLRISLTPETSVLTTPAEFAELFPGTGGALYGEATHGPRASFFRPTTRTRVPGLYLAGGSTHPGAGVPMAALSGRLAAEAVAADLASTRRFLPAGISGGISTGSRTTGPTPSPSSPSSARSSPPGTGGPATATLRTTSRSTSASTARSGTTGR